MYCPQPHVKPWYAQLFILLAILTEYIRAQDSSPTSLPSFPSDDLDDSDQQSPPAPSSLPAPPTASDNAPSFSTPTSNDTATDPSGGDDGHNDGLLNYYFLLLAVLIIIIIIVYWSLHRRRKAALLRQQSNQRDALAQDLDRTGWAQSFSRRGWRRGYGSGGTRIMHHEGLDETGEAPPPYVKEPERAHLGDDAASVELRDWDREGRVKPPDYVERGPS
ncbi:uncharacterized protein KY384_006149 [Bacidia gigantensis]|uniref:uncharacterized protein n=1 Tax=Bacidia gigantensis TaxID=2732470 RepID=UPI001D040DED|nr:uncharacterized protein KY384_006149 [Bacidia gigantensis]KAG8529512.1 hypothetical protein KY384_006149 [Bacidia gigantensis]